MKVTGNSLVSLVAAALLVGSSAIAWAGGSTGVCDAYGITDLVCNWDTCDDNCTEQTGTWPPSDPQFPGQSFRYCQCPGNTTACCTVTATWDGVNKVYVFGGYGACNTPPPSYCPTQPPGQCQAFELGGNWYGDCD